MLFTSYGFIGFILALFVVYYLIPRKFQWMLLLFSSYLFYFLASPKYLIYISVTTVTTFFASYVIDRLGQEQAAYLLLHKTDLGKEEKKLYKASVKTRQRRWLIACLILNFGILAIDRKSTRLNSSH